MTSNIIHTAAETLSLYQDSNPYCLNTQLNNKNLYFNWLNELEAACCWMVRSFLAWMLQCCLILSKELKEFSNKYIGILCLFDHREKVDAARSTSQIFHRVVSIG